MGASGGLGFFSMDDFYAAEYESPFESSGRRNEVRRGEEDCALSNLYSGGNAILLT